MIILNMYMFFNFGEKFDATYLLISTLINATLLGLQLGAFEKAYSNWTKKNLLEDIMEFTVGVEHNVIKASYDNNVQSANHRFDDKNQRRRVFSLSM